VISAAFERTCFLSVFIVLLDLLLYLKELVQMIVSIVLALGLVDLILCCVAVYGVEIYCVFKGGMYFKSGR
jgi:hypothetical protein